MSIVGNTSIWFLTSGGRTCHVISWHAPWFSIWIIFYKMAGFSKETEAARVPSWTWRFDICGTSRRWKEVQFLVAMQPDMPFMFGKNKSVCFQKKKKKKFSQNAMWDFQNIAFWLLRFKLIEVVYEIVYNQSFWSIREKSPLKFKKPIQGERMIWYHKFNKDPLLKDQNDFRVISN